jgi:hypothetical protein
MVKLRDKNRALRTRVQSVHWGFIVITRLLLLLLLLLISEALNYCVRCLKDQVMADAL